MKRKLLLGMVALFLLPNVTFGQTAPNLGVASGFALFTATGALDSNGATHVIGNVGSFTYTPIIYAPGVVTGSVYNASDPISATAASNVNAAYNDLLGRTSTNVIEVILGGQTLLRARTTPWQQPH